MKKILMVLCALFCLVGCSCNKDERVKLKYEEIPTVEDSSSYLYSEYGLLSYELDSTNEYDEKITNKDSFLLFVYREMCYGCQQLAPAFKAYIDENPNVILYTMEIDVIGSNHTLYKDQNITVTPYLILIEEGNIAYKETMPTDKTNVEKAKDWLDGWMKKHVVWEE